MNKKSNLQIFNNNRGSFLPSSLFFDDFIGEFSEDMNNFLLNFFTDEAGVSGISREIGNYPKVDIYDEKDKIIFEVELGSKMEKKDLTVKTIGDCLIISGKSRNKTEESSKKYLLKEIKKSSFSRTFRLNIDEYDLNEEHINAEFKDGNLIISINKIINPEKSTSVKEIEIK